MTIRPLPFWSTIAVEARVLPAASFTTAPESLPEISSLKDPLAVGDYKLTWHAVASDDGYRTTGTLPFASK